MVKRAKREVCEKAQRRGDVLGGAEFHAETRRHLRLMHGSDVKIYRVTAEWITQSAA